MEIDYLGQSGGYVRVKIVHVKQSSPDTVLTHQDLSDMSKMLEALEECRAKASAETYPQQFEALNPSPSVVVLNLEEAKRFADLLTSRSGISPYEKAVRVGIGQDIYIIAFEHHCG